NDTFVLGTTENVRINSGAGERDQVLLSLAPEGQHIDLDAWQGVVKVVGTKYADVVRSDDDANHHYVDQAEPASAVPGQPGDDVELLGPGDHLVEIMSGRVRTGAGDDMVAVREGMGGQLDIDLGAGRNLVSFGNL